MKMNSVTNHVHIQIEGGKPQGRILPDRAVALLAALGIAGLLLMASLPGEKGARAAAGKWSRAAHLPTCRSELASAVLKETIYAAGGLNLKGTSTAFEAYRDKSGEWKRLAPLQVSLHHPAMAAAREKVYITGGYTSLTFGKKERGTWAYDPRKGLWFRKADMPGPRAAHAMVNVGGKLYVVGGVGSPDLWIYDPAQDRWAVGGAPLPTPREHLAAVALNGKLYVIAGRWQGQGNLSVLEVYDPAREKWTRLAPMPTARGGLTAAVIRGKIHVTGGEAFSPAKTFNQHEVYDPASGTWSTAPALPTARHGLTSVSLRGHWYVIGGGTQAGFRTLYSTTCAVEVFQPGKSG